jgi:hypothetical protein
MVVSAADVAAGDAALAVLGARLLACAATVPSASVAAVAAATETNSFVDPSMDPPLFRGCRSRRPRRTAVRKSDHDDDSPAAVHGSR